MSKDLDYITLVYKSHMKIFLDTAETDVVRKHFKTGLIDGLTTNPSLIRKSGRKHEEVYQELKDIGLNDISMEVIGNTENMISEGKRLYKKFGKVATIKVPCTPDGLQACKELSDNGIKVNVTLNIFSSPGNSCCKSRCCLCFTICR